MALPLGAADVEVSQDKRIALLRATFPGGQFTLRDAGPVRIVREAIAEKPDTAANCFASRINIVASTAIRKADLAPAACQRGMLERWLGYDPASRSYFARREIPAGAYLGAIRVTAPAATPAGTPLVFRTSKGPVTVEREVVAIQPGRPRHRIFVRTEDGHVLRSSLAVEDDK